MKALEYVRHIRIEILRCMVNIEFIGLRRSQKLPISSSWLGVNGRDA